MAQLKDTIISGNLRVTNAVLTDTLQADSIQAHSTTSGTSAITSGTDGQVLKTNGTLSYWGDLPTSITDVTVGGSSVVSNGTAVIPAIPAAQVNSNWNASSGVAQILNKPTIPTISLNGSSTTSASFYAPTAAGTSGQVLTSNGSGAPTWADPSGGGGNIFIATYGTTTYADIQAAYAAGATILCKKDESVASGTVFNTNIAVMTVCTYMNLPSVVFLYTNGTKIYYWTLDRLTGDWATIMYDPVVERPVVTTYPSSGGMLVNKIYDLGQITGSKTFELNTTGLNSNYCCEWIWSFTTSSNASDLPTITWPSGLKWDGLTAPELDSGFLYEISVRKIGSNYVAYYKAIKL